MTSEANRNAGLRLIERAFHQHDLAAFDDYYAAHAVSHALPSGSPQGPEGAKLFAASFLQAFPDLRVTVDDMVADDEHLVTRWTARGTHLGDLMGIAPTGRTVTFGGMALDRFEDGKTAEHWEVMDQVGLMQQLGVMPAP